MHFYFCPALLKIANLQDWFSNDAGRQQDPLRASAKLSKSPAAFQSTSGLSLGFADARMGPWPLCSGPGDGKPSSFVLECSLPHRLHLHGVNPDACKETAFWASPPSP